jgi:putative transposase
MPWSLHRYQESAQSHFVTFSCHGRHQKFREPCWRDLFVRCLEQTRVRFQVRVYGFAVMPEHVHLLLSEPDRDSLASAVQSLKLAVAKRARTLSSVSTVTLPFWEKRYYDHNVRNYDKFVEKLRYIHRNPVVRGLVEKPEDWGWSSFRHYATGEVGVVEIESEWTVGKRPSVILTDAARDEDPCPH